ncbi:PepSY-associated TM helix domain-containing protein [Advenella kashmirensis]
MRSHHLLFWYRIHRWTSLICTVFVLILCLSGLPLVLKEEIGVWSGTTVEPPDLPGVNRRVSIDQLAGDALARRPGEAIRFISASDDSPAWFVSLGKTPDSAQATAVYKYDARTGEMIHDIDQENGLMLLIRKLHVELFAGLPGTLFIGLMGLLFVLSIVSGVVVYGIFMRGKSFGMVRKEKANRIKWLDLHNLLGIAITCWLMVVGATGVVNTLALPMLEHWQKNELSTMIAHWRDAAPAHGSAQQALDTARRAAPDMEVSFLGFPGSRFSTPQHFMVFMHGDTNLTSRLLEPVMVDAQSAKLVAAQPLPWYLSTLLVSQPLHFGDYGGIPMKLIWIVLDLICIVVLLSGLYLWWARRGAMRARLRALRENAQSTGSH